MSDVESAVLCEVASEVEAEMICSFLASQGIKAILKTALPPGVYPGLSRIKVLVSRADLAAAKKALENAQEHEEGRD